MIKIIGSKFNILTNYSRPINNDTNLMIQCKQKQSFISLHLTDEGRGHMLTFAIIKLKLKNTNVDLVPII